MRRQLDLVRILLRRRHLYREAFQGEEGQAVLRDLVRRFHVFAPVTVQGDPVASAFRDGARSVVLEIIKTLRLTNEEIYALEQKEELDD